MFIILGTYKIPLFLNVTNLAHLSNTNYCHAIKQKCDRVLSCLFWATVAHVKLGAIRCLQYTLLVGFFSAFNCVLLKPTQKTNDCKTYKRYYNRRFELALNGCLAALLPDRSKGGGLHGPPWGKFWEERGTTALRPSQPYDKYAQIRHCQNTAARNWMRCRLTESLVILAGFRMNRDYDEKRKVDHILSSSISNGEKRRGSL